MTFYLLSLPSGFLQLRGKQGFFFQNKPDEIKANPFVQSQYGNNSFNPQRLGTRPLVGS